jgi:glycosyltransferase involved in cell wall biosynthesis
MTRKKIKILFTIGSLGIGGKERQLIELIRSLPAEKYSIILLVKNIDAFYIKNIPNEVEIINLNDTNFGFKSIFKIKKIVKQYKPNIIHSWSTTTSFIFVLNSFITIKRKWKLVDGSIRLAHFPDKKFSIYSIQRLFINFFSDKIVANSYAGLKIFNVKKNGLVIYNGFDITRESKSIQLKNKPDLIIGMVARFDPMKDYPTFIKAALNLIEIRNNIHFYCIGSGVLYDEIYSLVPEEKMKHFSFTGAVENVEDFIVQFDIAVLSSFSEGISNSILEYFAHKKPVIATGDGGTSEIIQHNENGFLIPASDPNQLTQCILKLIDNKELRINFGNKGKETLLSKFSINKMLNDYNILYQSINS